MAASERPPPAPATPAGEGTDPPTMEPSKSDSHARAREADPGIMEQRVSHILDLMLRYRYRPVATARRLSAEWGVSVGYVKDLATEARKLVRAHVGNQDEIASQVVPALLRALRTATVSTDPKMVANVAGIAGQLLSYSGLNAPKKLEHSGPDGGPIETRQTGVCVLPAEVRDEDDEGETR